MEKAEHFLPVRNEMGETPIWVPGDSLYWVDVEGSAIYHWEPQSSSFGFTAVEVPVRALVRREGSGFIAVTKKGLFFWDPGGDLASSPASEADSPRDDFHPIPRTSIENPDICYNDGVVDRQGRFLVNTYNQKDLAALDGSLYRLDRDGSLHEIDKGLALPDGMGLSPDGRCLYLNELFRNRILVYDYDTEAGMVTNRRVFAGLSKEEGMPDGLTVDSEGGVSSAHWGGWRVTRYAPDGNIDRVIELPVSIVTCVGFGGTLLDELFITTAWYSLSDEERENQPLAGDLFRVKTGVKGIAEPGFIG